MPAPYQPMLGADGRPCLRPDGAPLIADAGGTAACACEECSTFKKIRVCNPGPCQVRNEAYICSTTRQCRGNVPMAGNVVAVGNDQLCWRVVSDTIYSSTVPTPTGMTPLPEDAVVVPDSEWSCRSDDDCETCTPQSGYYPMTPCGCAGATLPGTPVNGFFIKCECWAYHASGMQCPIYSWTDPLTGETTCWKRAPGPGVEALPEGAIDLCNNPRYCDCCQCCSGTSNGQCCSCDALGVPGGGPPERCPGIARCWQTLTRANLPTRMTPYGCCFQKGSIQVAGSGQLRYKYSGSLPFDFRQVDFKVEGDTLLITATEFDSNTGETTSVSTSQETFTGDCPLFPDSMFPSLSIVRSGFAPTTIPGVTIATGSIKQACDEYTWNYSADNRPGGGIWIRGSGSIKVVGSPGICDSGQCFSPGSGSLYYGCSGCGTITGASASEIMA